MISAVFLSSLILADFPICNDTAFQYTPCLSHLDSLYYVFWSDHRDPISIYGARLFEDGVVIDTGGVFLFQGYTTFGCRAANDGQTFMVVFRDSC